MKHREKITNIISFLYKVKQKGYEDSLSLEYVCEKLKLNLSLDDLRSIAREITAWGYVRTEYHPGATMIKLKTKGAIFIEEELSPDEKAKTEQYFSQNNINRSITTAVKKNKDAFLNKGRKDVTKVLKLVEQKLKKYNLEKNDFIIDLEILKLEINKQQPDREVFNIKIDNLNNLNLLDDIPTLHSLLNAP